MTIKELDPQIVWKNFYALTQIPRPSKHEELAVEYMYNWGKEHGLETIKDHQQLLFDLPLHLRILLELLRIFQCKNRLRLLCDLQ